MKYKILIMPDAQEDIKLAARWYNKQQKGLGNEFISSVRNCKKILKTNPFFIKRYKQIHTMPMKRFPFLIHYSIDTLANTIYILAVLHTSLNPETNWL